MKDFIRIGGEITSAPLNENFRRLRNDITISNTNLIFSKEYGIQMTVKDMQDLITNPEVSLENGQACYVVSSGELYRFATYDMQWHKIADFGQTFRQALLNTGVVCIQKNGEENGTITRKNNKTLTIPSMLVYFKALKGDERYLKGMYLVEEQDLDISSYVTQPGAYSIYLIGSEIDTNNNTANYYTISEGMPKTDNPERIYIGGFLVDGDIKIIEHFIYTIPDIAYTADRGFFYLTGGQVQGCFLQSNGTNDATVMGRSGSYYDEGINAPQGNLEDFPIDSYTGSNYNLRNVGALSPLDKLYYMCPNNPLSHPYVNTEGEILYGQWYNEATDQLENVGPGQFTIQRHIITPCGSNCTDIMLYGKRLYNSLGDALSNINAPDTLDLEFPYVEVTRVVVGYPLLGQPFTTDNPELCSFNTLERLGQVGTYEPKFADDKFMIYSGDLYDPDPSHFRFSLKRLQEVDYNGDYYLYLLSHETTRYDFALDKKYITEALNPDVTMSHADSRDIIEGINITPGYEIADAKDLNLLRERVNNIESEIWHIHDISTTNLYEQSIRYRLFHLEDRVSSLETRMTTAENNISTLFKTKVHKNTTINGYKLGDDLTNDNEAKTFNIMTGDINEGKGLNSTVNL